MVVHSTYIHVHRQASTGENEWSDRQRCWRKYAYHIPWMMFMIIHHNMDIGIMWHRALFSCFPSQAIGLFFKRPLEKPSYYAIAVAIRPDWPFVLSSFLECFQYALRYQFDTGLKMIYKFSVRHGKSGLIFITIEALWPSFQFQVIKPYLLQSWFYISR